MNRGVTEAMAYQLWLHFGKCDSFTPIALIETARREGWARHPADDWTVQGDYDDYHFRGKQYFFDAAEAITAALAAEPGAAEEMVIPCDPSEAETRAALDAYWQAVENGRGTMSASFTTNHSMRAALIGSRKFLAASPHQSGESGK